MHIVIVQRTLNKKKFCIQGVIILHFVYIPECDTETVDTCILSICKGCCENYTNEHKQMSSVIIQVYALAETAAHWQAFVQLSTVFIRQ